MYWEKLKNYCNKYCFLISTLILINLVFICPFHYLLNFSHDDSFFYIKIANNFSLGLGSTFDGVNYTNGYHPLWFIILSIIYFPFNYILNSSPESIYKITFSLHVIICVSISYFCYKIFTYTIPKESLNKVYSVFIILISANVFIRDVGMETPLICLLLSVYFYFKVKELHFENDYYKFKSVLLVLLFLCRTDYLLTLIPFIIISDYFTGRNKKKVLLLNIILIIIFPILYYSLNYYLFGDIFPVSQKVESTFPDINLFRNIYEFIPTSSFFYNQFLKLLFLLFTIIIFIYYANHRKIFLAKNFDYMLFFCCCGFLGFSLIHFAFNKNALREWYMTPPVFVSLILILKIYIRYFNITKLSIVFSFVFFLLICYFSRVQNEKFLSSYNYALKLKSIISNSDLVYQIDFSGFVGFFSERKIINGDGLVNSYEYLNYLKNGNLIEYFKKYNVKYYSTFIDYYLNELDTIFVDKKFSNNFGNYSFNFRLNKLILKEPYYYNHIVLKSSGEWLLFKLN